MEDHHEQEQPREDNEANLPHKDLQCELKRYMLQSEFSIANYTQLISVLYNLGALDSCTELDFAKEKLCSFTNRPGEIVNLDETGGRIDYTTVLNGDRDSWQ